MLSSFSPVADMTGVLDHTRHSRERRAIKGAADDNMSVKGKYNTVTLVGVVVESLIKALHIRVKGGRVISY